MVSQKDLLDKWSRKIKSDKLDETVAAVKNALAAYKKFPPAVKVAYYPHGSHHNLTNVQFSTPVDLIVEVTSVTGSNKDKKDPFEKKMFSYQSFRGDIIRAMQNAFGDSAVSEGNNSIHIAGTPSRQAANVLVCFKYKLFIRHGRDEVEREGVAFYTKDEKRLIINFPKQHHTYEAVKDKGSQGQFLPTVRVFKNIRNRLVTGGYLDGARVPSYFLESFISNAPSGMFTADYANSIATLLDFWKKNAWRNYLAIDGFRSLWGEAPQSWNEQDARYFLDTLRKVGKDATFWQAAEEV